MILVCLRLHQGPLNSSSLTAPPPTACACACTCNQHHPPPPPNPTSYTIHLTHLTPNTYLRVPLLSSQPPPPPPSPTAANTTFAGHYWHPRNSPISCARPHSYPRPSFTLSSSSANTSLRLGPPSVYTPPTQSHLSGWIFVPFCPLVPALRRLPCLAAYPALPQSFISVTP